MVLRAFEFSLIAFGIAFAVGFLVAAIIRLIAVVLNRGKGAAGNAGK